MIVRLIFAFPLILMLGGCLPRYHNVPVESPNDRPVARYPATSTKTPKPKPEIETIVLKDEDINVVTTETNTVFKDAPLDEDDADEKAVEIAKISPSKPVTQLVKQAEREYGNGNYEQAENALERALRISPRNATLWSKMARIKYAKGDYQQAASMAMRSNTMGGSLSQKKENWQIIADAREQLGDLSGAEQARKYAK
jgi:tetratricopeptide (TPR) repeat protein